MNRHESFAPHIDGETRLIILGSLPGARSLAQQQYYAHPQNNFWRLLESVFGAPLGNADYPMRLAMLRQLHIGLWDVIAHAERQGSLDSAIKKAAPQSLSSLFISCPKLEAIAFNGAKSAALGRKILGEKGDALTQDMLTLDIMSGPNDKAGERDDRAGVSKRIIHLINLPSSSPAHTLAFAKKLERWAELAPYAGTA